MYPPAIWPPPRILVRGDDQSAPLAGPAGRVSLVISDYRVCLVFVVDVLGVFRRVPQELSFLFAILRSEVRPNAHSTPRVPGVVQAPVAVRAQSDIPGARCERGEAGAGDRVAGSRAQRFFRHNTSFRLKPQVIICCPVLGAASSRRAPVRVGRHGRREPRSVVATASTGRQQRANAATAGGAPGCAPRLRRRPRRPAPKARRPGNRRCLRPSRNSRRACRAGYQVPAPYRSRGRGSRRPCQRHCWSGCGLPRPLPQRPGPRRPGPRRPGRRRPGPRRPARDGPARDSAARDSAAGDSPARDGTAGDGPARDRPARGAPTWLSPPCTVPGHRRPV